MADQATKQAQQTSDPFRISPIDSDEWARLAHLAIDETARLQHTTLTYAAQLGAEWRRLFTPRSSS